LGERLSAREGGVCRRETRSGRRAIVLSLRRTRLDAKPYLQGWGRVENSTDEDWKDVAHGPHQWSSGSASRWTSISPLFVDRPPSGSNSSSPSRRHLFRRAGSADGRSGGTNKFSPFRNWALSREAGTPVNPLSMFRQYAGFGAPIPYSREGLQAKLDNKLNLGETRAIGSERLEVG